MRRVCEIKSVGVGEWWSEYVCDLCGQTLVTQPDEYDSRPLIEQIDCPVEHEVQEERRQREER